MSMDDVSNTVEYQILMDAVQAQKTLQSLTANISNVDTKMTEIINEFANFSLKSGLHIKTVSAQFENLEKRAEDARKVIQLMTEAGMEHMIPPDLKSLAEIKPLFAANAPAMWKELNMQLGIYEKETRNAEKVTMKLAQAEEKLAAAAQNAAKSASAMPASFMGKTLGTPEEAQKIISTLQQVNKLNFLDPRTYKANVQSLSGIIQELATQTGTSFRDVGSYISKSFSNIPNIAMASKDAVGQLEKGIKGASNAAEHFRRGIDAVRIAMGTLVAMAIFRFFNFLEQAVRKSIESIKQLEVAVYQLTVAERTLSEAGVDVSMDDFRKTIEKVKEVFSFISDIDLKRMTAQIAMAAKDLKLPWEEAEKILMAIPVLAQRAGISIEQATQQVINGLTTSGRGWKDLFVNVDANIIKQEAVNLALVDSIAAYDKLTAEQKQQIEVLALISILNKNVADEIENQSDQEGTLTEATRGLSGAWEDFLTVMGQNFGPVLSGLLGFIKMVLESWMEMIQAAQPVILRFVASIGAGFRLLNALIYDQAVNLGNLQETYKKFYDDIFNSIEELNNLPEVDTPTGIAPKITPELDLSKAEDEIEDLLKDLEKLDQKEIDIEFEFKEKQGRELQDFLEDMSRFEEDYLRKRKRAAEDGRKDLAEKEKKYRDKEKDEEAKFQERMRQLREQYLFDLEDALRERDARQVLRLMRKYEMDKENLTNEYNLRKKQEAEQHAQEMEDARKELADKLALMDEEHAIEKQRREEDFALKRQRQEEDHAQEMEELRRQREERIQEAANAIAEELGIKGDGVKALYDMLNSFYGEGGAFDGLYDYTNRSMVARAEQMLEQLRQIAAQAQAYANSMTQGLPNPRTPGVEEIEGGAGSATGSTGGKTGTRKPRGGHIGGRAQGGTFLATSPTTARFGEAGPELASFIPLGRPGASGSRTGASLGQSGGQVVIEMLLSPDLEARVVENTLNKSAEIVAKVVNSKRM